MARLTVEFSDRLDAMLDDLAKSESTTKADVLRKALALFKFAHDEGVTKAKGDRRLSVTDPSKNKILKDILI